MARRKKKNVSEANSMFQPANIDTTLRDSINNSGIDSRSADQMVIDHEKLGKDLGRQDWEQNTFGQKPLMIGTDSAPVTPEEYRKNQRIAKAEAKASRAAAGTGSSDAITSGHKKWQEVNTSVVQDTEASRYISGIADQVGNVDKGLVDEFVSGEKKAREFFKEFDAKDKTGRKIDKYIQSETAGYMPVPDNNSGTSGALGNKAKAIGSQATPGTAGTYMNTETVSETFNKRLSNIDAKKGTDHFTSLSSIDAAEKGINTYGASSVKGYRGALKKSIPKESAVYNKINSMPKPTGSVAGKVIKEGTEEAVEKGLLKGMSAGKVGKIAAGMGVAALVVSNMNKSKGQQSNQELYGQRTPYGG